MVVVVVAVVVFGGGHVFLWCVCVGRGGVTAKRQSNFIGNGGWGGGEGEGGARWTWLRRAVSCGKTAVGGMGVEGGPGGFARVRGLGPGARGVGKGRQRQRLLPGTHPTARATAGAAGNAVGCCLDSWSAAAAASA